MSPPFPPSTLAFLPLSSSAHYYLWLELLPLSLLTASLPTDLCPFNSSRFPRSELPNVKIRSHLVKMPHCFLSSSYTNFCL